MPLVYGSGEVAQVDFFEVWVELAGVRQKSWLFLMRLMHSGRATRRMLCAQQDTTWFLAAHVAAFTHFAGVVAAVTYDNLTAAGSARCWSALRAFCGRASQRSRRTTRSSLDSAVPAKGTTRAGSSAAADTFDGSTWCRCRKAGRSRR